MAPVTRLGYVKVVTLNPTYASIAIVDVPILGKITVETISLQADTSVLAGAWVIELENAGDVTDVLSGKIIVSLDQHTEGILKAKGLSNFVEMQTFLTEAIASASNTLEAFMKYVAEESKKRSKLVNPNLTIWPDSIDLRESVSILEGMGKQAFSYGTPVDFRKTLAASRLLKIYLDSWLSDESERVARPYLNLHPDYIRLLPHSWSELVSS